MNLTATEIGIVAAIGVVFFGLVGFDWWRHRGRRQKTGPDAAVNGPDAGIVWLATMSHEVSQIGHGHGTVTGADGGGSSGSDGT